MLKPHKKILYTLATGALLSCSTLSYAHFPFVRCAQDKVDIVCEAGFSDGSSAAGVTVDLISYDEEVIASKHFDDDSKAHFKPYDGEFYILLDAGPGHTVEVDWQDVLVSN